FLGHFGGFLDERLRASDFALGYRSALAWLADPERGFGAVGVDPALASACIDAAQAGYQQAWETEGIGKIALSGPPLPQRLQLLRLARRMAGIAIRENGPHL